MLCIRSVSNVCIYCTSWEHTWSVRKLLRDVTGPMFNQFWHFLLFAGLGVWLWKIEVDWMVLWMSVVRLLVLDRCRSPTCIRLGSRAGHSKSKMTPPTFCPANLSSSPPADVYVRPSAAQPDFRKHSSPLQFPSWMINSRFHNFTCRPAGAPLRSGAASASVCVRVCVCVLCVCARVCARACVCQLHSRGHIAMKIVPLPFIFDGTLGGGRGAEGAFPSSLSIFISITWGKLPWKRPRKR